VAELDLVWSLSDTFNGLMAVPNLIGLLLLSPVIVKETRRNFQPETADAQAPADES
jgi:AGCS family alanine or glycine:cation symporter